MTARHAPKATYPRSVTPGIESHPEHPQVPPPGVYVGLDWLRFTGPEDFYRARVEDLLQAFAGTKPERNRGAAYFTEGKQWKPGILLSWGHRSRVCQVDIQGGRLRLMNGDDRMKLFRALMELGMKPTRIDGCIDFVDQGYEIYTNARESCDRDELCRCRTYGDNSRRTVGQRPNRLHLNLGRRESPVCGRIYDKGLETKTTETAGRWERLEIEWKGDRAPQVGLTLYDSLHDRPRECVFDWGDGSPPEIVRHQDLGQGWADTLAALVFGAVDFRKVTGQSKLDRRPRSEWWERVVARHEEVLTSPAQKSPDLARWVEAFRVNFGRRVLEFAAAVDRPGEEVFVWLVGGLEPSDNGGQLVREFTREYRSSAGKSKL
ncbi:MAG: replication initiation factor domain-containing protein [Phycisphaerales bacterium]